MNNKKLGNKFEKELCELLAKHGFWAYNCPSKTSGQPADIIAVRNRISHLIDAKVCSDNKFLLKRVEENQDLAMDLWQECGNGIGWFALKTDGGVYMISHYVMKAYKDRQYSLSAKEIFELGTPIEKWVKKCK